MSFQREEPTEAFLREMFPLLELHYRELCKFKDCPLDPDLTKYLDINKMGNLRVYTARKDGALIGYCVYFLMENHMHYRSLKVAMQDVLFIHPDHRGEGLLFMSWCSKQLQKDGVAVEFQHFKVDADKPALLERMGFKPHEKIYCKDLREA